MTGAADAATTIGRVAMARAGVRQHFAGQGEDFLDPCGRVEVEISGVGVLSNSVIDESEMDA